MSLIGLLDAGPLGMITNPRSSPESEECKNWLTSTASGGAEVIVPEIADYEVRRELLRAGKAEGIRAAEFWAPARNMGRQSATDASLDADMILAAQATILGANGGDAVIATTNVRHLALFASARIWREIR